MWGWADYDESHTASDQPERIELADLEAGTKTIGNNHVVIGPHSAYYAGSIYSYTRKKFAPKKTDDNTPITECFYPIMAPSNPGVKKVEELKKKYKTVDDIPDEELAAIPLQFVLVVRTTRYKKIGEIPSSVIQTDPQVQGLILNHTKLKTDEKKLLNESFPRMNMDKVIILEEGRTPSSSMWCFTRVGAGVLITVLGLVIVGCMIFVPMFRKPPERRRRNDRYDDDDDDDDRNDRRRGPRVFS
jgi:hypothetical protein